MSRTRALLASVLPERVRHAWYGVRRRLGRWRRRVAAWRYGVRTCRHTYGGRPLTVHLGDPMSAAWYDHDWDAPTEIALLRARGGLRPGARVFDVGAHQAVVAMMLAGCVAPGGEVIAVEAVPHNVRLARLNVASNACTAVHLVPAAISDADGALWFDDSWNGSVSDLPGFGVRVEALTIDTLTARYGAPAVLFIDVEGYELHALRGAAKTLAAHRPDLYVEVHVGAGLDRFGTADDVLALLPAGYDVLVAPGEAGEFVPLADGRHLRAERFRLVALAPRTTEIIPHD